MSLPEPPDPILVNLLARNALCKAADSWGVKRVARDAYIVNSGHQNVFLQL